MSKRLHLSGSLKNKLKTQGIEKEKLFPSINVIFNRDDLEDNSYPSITVKSTLAETTDISKLKFPSITVQKKY